MKDKEDNTERKMAEFADLFRDAVARSHKSLYELEKLTGIDRSYLSKVRSGKRIPAKEEWIVRVLSALGADAQIGNDILQAWKKEQTEGRFGEGSWSCMVAMEKIFFGKFQARQSAEVYSYDEDDSCADVIRGRENIIRWLLNGIRTERVREIDVWGAQDCLYLLDILEACLKSEVICRHIVYFQTGCPMINDAQNIRVFGTVWRCVLAGSSYRPVIGYRDLTKITAGNPFWGSIVLAGETVMLLDADYESGILLTDPLQAAAVRQSFERAYASVCTPFEEYEDIHRWLEKKQAVEEAQAGKSKAKQLYVMKCPVDFRSVSASGMPPELEIVCGSERQNYMVIPGKQGKKRYLSLQEPIIAKWLYCFMQYLENSGCLYSEEEQLTLLP